MLENLIPAHSCSNLGQLSPNLGHNFFFEVLALLDVTYCPKMQSCAISRKTSDAALRKWQQAEFWTQFPPPSQLEAIILSNFKKITESNLRK